MDALVVLGGTPPPERLVARARHVIHLAPGAPATQTVAELRVRIPRMVGVFGDLEAAAEVAVYLRQHGFPVVLLSDEADSATASISGVEIYPASDTGAEMEVANSLLDLVGNTPLVRLDRIGRDLPCHLLAKLEQLNPGGSVKDRVALTMVEAAEREGLLGPGGTIVEPTSGNTGVGLAIVAARRRYGCVFVVPDKVSREKILLLRAYGAEVVVCPTGVPPEHPESYYSVASRLASEIPGAFQPDQYHNPHNPLAHELTTGPEIWRQSAGRVTHFVAGVGTGGTISGVGRYLKSQNPAVRVIGADPEGSVYSGGAGRPYLVEGIGEDFWPATYDAGVVDSVVRVSDADSFSTTRRVTREEGILVGGSAGTAVWAALQVGRDLGPDDVVVVLIPDSGRGYLSKVYDDEWMADHGFLHSSSPAVADVLASNDNPIPALVHVHPEETARDAIRLMREFGVSQLPVLKAEPPLAAIEVVGAVEERGLMELSFEDPTALDRPVGEIMAGPLPTVGSGESLDVAARRLKAAPAAIVLDRGHPVGVLARSDLLEFLCRRRPSEVRRQA